MDQKQMARVNQTHAESQRPMLAWSAVDGRFGVTEHNPVDSVNGISIRNYAPIRNQRSAWYLQESRSTVQQGIWRF